MGPEELELSWGAGGGVDTACQTLLPGPWEQDCFQSPPLEPPVAFYVPELGNLAEVSKDQSHAPVWFWNPSGLRTVSFPLTKTVTLHGE